MARGGIEVRKEGGREEWEGEVLVVERERGREGGGRG
jgi:hypothetical protein